MVCWYGVVDALSLIVAGLDQECFVTGKGKTRSQRATSCAGTNYYVLVAREVNGANEAEACTCSPEGQDTLEKHVRAGRVVRGGSRGEDAAVCSLPSEGLPRILCPQESTCNIVTCALPRGLVLPWSVMLSSLRCCEVMPEQGGDQRRFANLVALDPSFLG